MEAAAAGAMTREAHRRALADAAGGAGGAGTLEQVGAEHLILSRPGADTLLVTFDTLDAARARAGGLPIGSALAEDRGWGTLDVLADGRTWFREPALVARFDAMADAEAFEEYDTVLFAGGGMGGYGAAAYSLACPGAVVLAIQPVATLDRDVAPWETRFREARGLSFGPRYGDATRSIEAAMRCLVVTDPAEAEDAMHASLFRGGHVTRLVAVQAGRDILGRLDSAGILDELLAGAADGSLDAIRFARLWRARRSDPGWIAGLMRRIERMDRPWLTALVAASMVRQGGGPGARRRLDAALSRLAPDARHRIGGSADEPVHRGTGIDPG